MQNNEIATAYLFLMYWYRTHNLTPAQNKGIYLLTLFSNLLVALWMTEQNFSPYP